VVIFSEWIKAHKIIGGMLKKHKVAFAELNGQVPVKKRGDLIKHFEQTPDCRIFLSTEAGGAGLNLQAADILINFELPWNPAKKNQRIGRIDRLGQKSSKLTIFNLVTRDSIEQHIAAGLLVKQSLFEGVLSKSNAISYVDFSSKGRSQFIQQLETLINQPAPEQSAALPATFPAAFPAASLATSPVTPESVKQAKLPAEELEKVLANGMRFLASLFKMSTGADFNFKDQKIEVDKNTGEVVMRFKIT
jgi:superfamily II DNA/RNA helicase